MQDELVLDFDPLQSIGFLATEWVEQHCKVPGGVFEGEPLVFNGWQLYCTANHYRIKKDAEPNPRRVVAPFYYRRSIVVGPQKSGKSPWGAGMALTEGVGPSLFAGWATKGDKYRCSDHGCDCGWEYVYEPGEAMGVPRRKSLIGLMATAEDQTFNIYEPLQSFVLSGPLKDVARVREGFIRLPNRGLIQPVTAAAKSKLGRPMTAAFGDESGIYVGQTLEAWKTIRRGVTGMQGRTVELTNPWDPMDNSAAQQAFESSATDIFRYYKKPPEKLKYTRARDREKIHAYVYEDSPWVDPEAIDADASELMEKDPTSAERFFGNRLVQGLGAFITDELWKSKMVADIEVPDGAEVCGGMDGSRSGDWTAIRLETRDGHRFTPTYGSDDRPTIWNPAEWGGQIPRGEVQAAVDAIVRKYKVRRFYVDPRHWETQTDAWSVEHGEDVFIQWPTNSINRMYGALDRYQTDLVNEPTATHDACVHTRTHALNARKVEKPGDKYVLGKPSAHQKIDLIMADVLAHEAAADQRAAGWLVDDGPTYFRLSR